VAVFLDEMQCGTDRRMIGFPNLMLCMGVVLLYKDDMFGMHFTHPGCSVANAQVLRHYTKSLGLKPNDAVALYGCCNWDQRYAAHGALAKQRWKDDLRLIAKLLKYSGPARGFDTTIIASAEPGRYIEFRPAYPQKRCRIFWKVQQPADFTRLALTAATAPLEVGRTVVEYRRDPMTDQFGLATGNRDVTLTTAFADTGGAAAGETLAEIDYAQRLIQFTV
jgi:hypothetical protein